jgi:dihydroxy-acid dehydratase
MITLSGCDKTIPGAVMPIARLDAVGITLYGGTILPGSRPGHEGKEYLTQQSAFEAVGQLSAGVIDIEEFHAIECNACPGSGSCGGMFTANTMASCNEALGVSLLGTASAPAVSAGIEDGIKLNGIKARQCRDSVTALFAMLERGGASGVMPTGRTLLTMEVSGGGTGRMYV